MTNKEQIRQQIENINSNAIASFSQKENRYDEGCLDVCNRLLSFLDTLQETEVDIDDVSIKYVEEKFGKDIDGCLQSPISTYDLMLFAEHFYSLGQNEKQGEQKPVEWSGKIGSKHAEGKLKEMLDNMKPVEWSEEDERIQHDILDHLYEYYVEKRGYPYKASEGSQELKEINWLNSLRHQKQQLDKVISDLTNIIKDAKSSDIGFVTICNYIGKLKKK